jgi:signal transduction histidine kinase
LKTQYNLKALLIFVLACLLATVITITLFTIQKINYISESQNISNVRAYTSTVINQVKESYPIIDEASLETSLDELNMTALITDLQGNVVYNNSSFSSDNVLSDLNQIQPFILNGIDMVKVSFHIVNESGIVGFIIFEIPEDELLDNNDNLFLMIICFEVIFTVILIIYLVRKYRRIILIPIRQLDNALLDIANGVYNTLKANKGAPKERFTNYNIMIEQLERSLSLQADYEKSRKQLIANISHEIRTPLSYVKLSTEILSKNECMNENNKKYIDTILSKITAIDGIIEDLFRYSKQDLDKLLVVLKETYSKDLFDRIFNNIKLKDNTKKIIIQTNNKIPNFLISVDENRLDQVVSNMVDNAEKHIKGEGFINIRTEIEENHLVLIIEDSGDGIAPKDLPYIFEPFYQGKQDDDTKIKGAGLGLAICDYIVKKHFGEIFVYSEVNKGTKFVIKFQEIE